MNPETKIIMKLRNETKGALRFEETDGEGRIVTMKDDDCKIGTLYLRKAGFPGQTPKQIIVTVASV